MRTCPRCSRPIPDLATQFCPNCGLTLTAEALAERQREMVEASSAPASATDGPKGPTYGDAYDPAHGARRMEAWRQGTAGRPGEKSAYDPRRRIIAWTVACSVVVVLVVGLIDQLRAHPIYWYNPYGITTTTTGNDGTLLADPLQANQHGWVSDANHCYFTNSGYHIGGGSICYAPIGAQTDGLQSVTVQQVSGPLTDGYGLVFRSADANNYYEFAINSSGQWAFFKVVNGQETRLQDYTMSSAIDAGLYAGNILSVIMNGSTFDCYVNGQSVGTIHDISLSKGKWGLTAGAGLEVVFTEYLAQQIILPSKR